MAAAACLTTISAGVKGEGRLSPTTLSLSRPKFSWELGGSMASLLGTGVMLLAREILAIELDFVVSLRQGDELSVGGVAFGVDDIPLLAKKPRMLLCLPVEAGLRAVDGVRAGVWPGAMVIYLSCLPS